MKIIEFNKCHNGKKNFQYKINGCLFDFNLNQ